METLSTVGYGEMSPSSLYGYAIACVEMVAGMAFVALLTGILFVRFSRSQTGIMFADHAVVTIHNGNQTLMVRIGNGRSNMLTQATAKLTVLLKETSDEGQVSRRYHNLDLICPQLPAFPLTWTIMHVMGPASPLYGFNPEKLREAWGRLFLSVEARDSKLGREVNDLFDYDFARVLFDSRYGEAMTYDKNGLATADLSKVGAIEMR